MFLLFLNILKVASSPSNLGNETVLLIICSNRHGYLERTLNAVLKYHPRCSFVDDGLRVVAPGSYYTDFRVVTATMDLVGFPLWSFCPSGMPYPWSSQKTGNQMRSQR